MTRRALLLASAAVPTSHARVSEPKDFPDPFWRGLMFGWDDQRGRDHDGLIAYSTATEQITSSLVAEYSTARPMWDGL
jgi:hypothetical protein